ncbi:hypothetical protein HYH02_014595 [Chlamydomonas schloesseri]|uniref:Methyltransferase FkbM domain-containing protein n=1 Tax=Chlamydomonas schloesseri TaxID=2026947 RepID=A0A835VTM4_9CHLO|nr:hypothetical protein HYH02_014595 [Chlamydomonas schloesseri]|eukprot:KAG2427375.1 hypothetical protein HYH02_014595 [Chlamydomonas schloesseri]
MNRTTFPNSGEKQPIFVYTNGDGVSSWILNGQEHEPHELNEIFGAMSRSKSRSPLYVDVGANVGSLCLRVAAKYRVVAFEGMGANLLLLRNSICAFPGLSDRLQLFPFGLSDAESKCPIYSQPTNMGDGIVACSQAEQAKLLSEGCQQRGELRLKRLDAVLNEPIEVLKIDVEGFEAFVLSGTKGLLRKRAVRHLMVEFWERTSPQAVAELAELGFQLSLKGFSGPWSTVEEVQKKIAADKIVNVYCKLSK